MLVVSRPLSTTHSVFPKYLFSAIAACGLAFPWGLLPADSTAPQVPRANSPSTQSPPAPYPPEASPNPLSPESDAAFFTAETTLPPNSVLRLKVARADASRLLSPASARPQTLPQADRALGREPIPIFDWVLAATSDQEEPLLQATSSDSLPLRLRILYRDAWIRVIVTFPNGSAEIIEAAWEHSSPPLFHLAADHGTAVALHQIDVPLDLLAFWLRPEELTPGIQQPWPGWPDALTQQFGSTEGTHPPAIPHVEDQPLGAWLQGTSALHYPSEPIPNQAAEVWLLLQPLRHDRAQNPFCDLGMAGRGIVYSGPKRTLDAAFASDQSSQWLVDFPPAKPVWLRMLHDGASVHLEMDGVSLGSQAADDLPAWAKTWIFGGASGRFGELLLSEALLFHGELSGAELQRMRTYATDRINHLHKALLALWSQPTPSDPTNAAFVARLQALQANRATFMAHGPDIAPGLGRSPHGGRIWYVDNLRGNDANQGWTLHGPSGPLRSLDAAYLKARDGDLIFVIATGRPYPVTAHLRLESGIVAIASNGPFDLHTKPGNTEELVIGKHIRTRPSYE